MESIKDLQAAINLLTLELEEKSNQLTITRKDLEALEIDPYDFEEDCITCLDDCHEEYMGFCASDILKNCDPIAYRCGLLDYVDSIDKEDTEEGRELLEQIEVLEYEQESISDEIDSLLEKIEELEKDL